jgi:hypothetical protein
MSEKHPIVPVEAVEALKPRSAIWRNMQAQLEARDAQTCEVAERKSSLVAEHFQEVVAQLKEQPLFGHDFEHTDNFFHRFMRAATDDVHATDLHDILTLDRHVRLHQATLSPSLQIQLARKAASGASTDADKAKVIKRTNAQWLSRGQAKATQVKTHANLAVNMSPKKSATAPKLGVHERMLQDGELWGQEPRYKLSRMRRRYRMWGDKFTLTRPHGREPFYFDHNTTFYPLELRPPPDVDFIPFELYAALGVMVGWQWMVDEFVRKDFVSDRTNNSALDVFLANYHLIGVSPAVALQGAVAHYPSEEHMLRILQYLKQRSRAEARMRIELLDRSGKTVAEVWANYGVLRRSAKTQQ